MISFIFALMTAPSSAFAGPMFNRMFLAKHPCETFADQDMRDRPIAVRSFLSSIAYSNQAVFSLLELDEINAPVGADDQLAYLVEGPQLKSRQEEKTKDYLDALFIARLNDTELGKLRALSVIKHASLRKATWLLLDQNDGPQYGGLKIGAWPLRIASFLAAAPGLNVQGWSEVKDAETIANWAKPLQLLIAGLTSNFQSVATKHFPMSESSATEALQEISASSLMKMATDFSVLRFIEEELFGSSIWVDGTVAPWMKAIKAYYPKMIQAHPFILQFLKQMDQSLAAREYRMLPENRGRRNIEIRTPNQFYAYLSFLLKSAQEQDQGENWALKELEKLVELRQQIHFERKWL